MSLLTVIESPLFSRDWPDYWTQEEHDEFVQFIAGNPEAGDVVPGSGGCRKIRWGRQGQGKSGGVRIIYVNHLVNGAVVALLIYSKAANDNIPGHVLKQIAEELGHATE